MPHEELMILFLPVPFSSEKNTSASNFVLFSLQYYLCSTLSSFYSNYSAVLISKFNFKIIVQKDDDPSDQREQFQSVSTG